MHDRRPGRGFRLVRAAILAVPLWFALTGTARADLVPDGADVSATADEATAPVVGEVTGTVGEVTTTVDETTDPIVEEVTTTVQETTDPIVEEVTGTVEELTTTVDETTDPILGEATDPVVEEVAGTLEEVTTTVEGTTDPTLEEVTGSVDPAAAVRAGAEPEPITRRQVDADPSGQSTSARPARSPRDHPMPHGYASAVAPSPSSVGPSASRALPSPPAGPLGDGSQGKPLLPASLPNAAGSAGGVLWTLLATLVAALVLGWLVTGRWALPPPTRLRLSPFALSVERPG